ncbi:MAG: tetratricopeptide repeat protein, partial [Planctomycetota bacterium]
RFADKPRLDAQAHETIGMTFLSLWLFEDARIHLEEARNLRGELLGDDHPDTLRSMLQLAYLVWQAGTGDFSGAEALARSSHLGMQRHYGTDDARTLTAAHVLANVLAEQGRYEQAEPLFRRTLAAQRRVRPGHRDTLMTMWDWSVFCLAYGKERQGQELIREAHDLGLEKLGPDDTITLMSQIILGWYLVHAQQPDRAEAVLRSGLDRCRRVLGENHPFTYFAARLRAGSPLLEDPGRKEQLLREALAGQRAALGEQNRETIRTMLSLGRLLMDRGERDHGLQLMRQSVDLSVGIAAIDARSSLARALYRVGQLDEAARQATKVVEAARSMSERSDATAFDLYRCAKLLLTVDPPELRDPGAALAAATKAVELSDAPMHAERHLGRPAYLHDMLALAYEATGDLGSATSPDAYDLALEAAEQAVRMQPNDGTAASTLGAAQYRTGRYELAVATLLRSDRLNGGASPVDAAMIALTQGKLGHADDAEAAMARLRELMRDPANDTDPDNRLLREEARGLLPDIVEALTLEVPGEYPTIRHAVGAAVNGAEIVIADGTYTGADNRDVDPEGKAITIRSANGPDRCIIDCDGAGRAFIFHRGETHTTVLEGLTIRNAAVEGDGGAISCDGSSPTIRNCVFTGNTATGDAGGAGGAGGAGEAGSGTTALGGAIFLSTSAARIESCRFTGNRTTGGGARSGGGAIACIKSGEPVIRDCTFTANVAEAGTTGLSGVGGAVHCSSSSPTISDCTFERNKAIAGAVGQTGLGGAIQVFLGPPTISNCTFTGNEAVGGQAAGTGMGGAIHASLGTQTITGCRFRANKALGGAFNLTGLGGAVQVSASTNTTITDCLFIDNTASGGAVGISGAGGAIVCSETRNNSRLTNCILSGNTATGDGGGMWCGGVNGGPRPTVINCTFGDNSAGGRGGGLYGTDVTAAHTVTTLVNCIVWGNSPDEIVNVAGAVTIVSSSNVRGGWPGRGNTSTDPLFVDRGNSDYHLAAGSACIDAGDTTALSNSGDLDGKPRFVDDPDTLDTGLGDRPIVDMGAYEFQR